MVSSAPTEALAVGIWLQRDAVVGGAHADLVCGATAQLHAFGCVAGSFDLQFEVGDRAVERVVLPFLRIAVDPGDEVAPLGRGAAPQPHFLPRDLERAAGG